MAGLDGGETKTCAERLVQPLDGADILAARGVQLISRPVRGLTKVSGQRPNGGV